VAICPPHVYLDAVVQAVRGSAVGVGAQNIYHEAKGPFTGEVSAPMVKDLGCRYAIVGHSERRTLFRETDQDVHRKLQAALIAGLTPIVCVGESLEQRQSGQTEEVIQSQFKGSIAPLDGPDIARCVIAYEPVWAIGTGKVATGQQAEEVHALLRRLLEQTYGSGPAAEVRIQYGGSVNAENAADLLRQPNIDGALVGGASLQADTFLTIVAAAQALS
jgi:triosephosphate isomerase